MDYCYCVILEEFFWNIVIFVIDVVVDFICFWNYFDKVIIVLVLVFGVLWIWFFVGDFFLWFVIGCVIFFGNVLYYYSVVFIVFDINY